MLLKIQFFCDVRPCRMVVNNISKDSSVFIFRVLLAARAWSSKILQNLDKNLPVDIIISKKTWILPFPISERTIWISQTV